MGNGATENRFVETASLPGLIGPTGGEGQIGLLARKSCRGNCGGRLRLRLQGPEEKSWLVFTDASGVGEVLVSRLRALGARCRVARRGKRFRVRWQGRFYLATGNAGRLANSSVKEFSGLLTRAHRLSLESRYPVNGADMATNLDALLHLTQALESAASRGKLRLDLVTRNAQPAGNDPRLMAVAQAPSIGLMRVILNEYSNLSWGAIDLPPKPSPSDAASSLARAIAQRQGTRDRLAR